MTALYDADLATNWELIYVSPFAATYPQGKYIPIYNPIPRQELALNVTSSLLAVHCTSDDFPKQQRYLGRIIQAVTNPRNLPGSIANGKGVGLYSNQTVLAEFPRFDDNYHLILAPRYYVEQITVGIYQYVGSAFYEVEARLNVIEGKIDQLL